MVERRCVHRSAVQRPLVEYWYDSVYACCAHMHLGHGGMSCGLKKDDVFYVWPVRSDKN